LRRSEDVDVGRSFAGVEVLGGEWLLLVMIVLSLSAAEEGECEWE